MLVFGIIITFKKSRENLIEKPVLTGGIKFIHDD